MTTSGSSALGVNLSASTRIIPPLSLLETKSLAHSQVPPARVTSLCGSWAQRKLS